MLKLTNKRENREEMHETQRKYPWIKGTWTVYYFFSLTEFLLEFFKVEFDPLGTFGQNVYPFLAVGKCDFTWIVVVIHERNYEILRPAKEGLFSPN